MPWGVPKLGTSVESASGNFTLIEPAGVAEGDLMVACIGYRGNASIVIPANWVQPPGAGANAGDTDATNGIASGLMIYIVRGASAPDLVCVRTGGDVALARIISYSGVRPSNPHDTATGNTLASASATVTTGALTTAEANELIVAMTSAGDTYNVSAFDATDPSTASGATDTTNAPSAGVWRERSDVSTGTGADGGLAIADAVKATAGSTGTIQATVGGSARHVMVAAAFFLYNAPPTVVLNSPAHGATDQTTTPTLDFTGTDPEADPIEYNIQIAPNAAFGAIDSYSESNTSVGLTVGQSSGDHGLGQSFTGNGRILTSALFYLKSTLGATGNAVAKIYAHSGTFGTSSLPTGSALATSDNFDVATLGTGYDLAMFTFSGANQIMLVNTTKYVVTLEYNSAGASSIQAASDNTSASHSGNLVYQNSSNVWAALSTYDLCFYVRSAILDKFSQTDAGFVNPDTGGDTHPFNSGENIRYTVQSGEELSLERTYYWRVRGIDPAGGNLYGAWSATRTFGPL